MLPVVSVFVGVTLFVLSSYCLWLTLAKPKAWARFTETEMAFMLKRGFPVKWAGPYKSAQQGYYMKLLSATCAFFAALLAVAPFLLHYHG